MSCKKYRIKKIANKSGAISYVAQRKIFGLFWYGMFREKYFPEDLFAIPEIFWDEDKAVSALEAYLKSEQERLTAYNLAKEKIKNNQFVCVE